ncbi:MAG: uracil-DNA glycosylase [Desulfurococcales archaeon]|nr:uracil-DNA glycosylase [Desulfurococcales archaeon]
MEDSEVKRKSYEKLVAEIGRCTRCPLHLSRRNPVPGEGPLDADVMLIGEAPGRVEDETGRPFVGPAGRLLTALLESIGLKRDRVYITNVVKCRPPNNRDPSDEELRACTGYLLRQIGLVKPKTVVLLGRVAGRHVYGLAGLKWSSIREARGKIVTVSIGDVRVRLVATFHPAAALYNPTLRRELEEDFKGAIREAVLGEKGDKKKTLMDFM